LEKDYLLYGGRQVEFEKLKKAIEMGLHERTQFCLICGTGIRDDMGICLNCKMMEKMQGSRFTAFSKFKWKQEVQEEKPIIKDTSMTKIKISKLQIPGFN
jgi:hypothetical protein